MDLDFTRDSLGQLIKAVPGDIAVYLAKDGRLETYYYSDGLPELSGLTNDEYEKTNGSDALNIVIGSDKKSVENDIFNLVRNGSGAHSNAIYRIYNKKTDFVWIRARAKNIGTLDGYPVIITEFFDTTADTDGFANLVDSTDNIVYIVDSRTYELYYANRKAIDSWGRSDYIGHKCYEFINGKPEMCSWCSVRRMTGHSYHDIHAYDPENGLYFNVFCKDITWFGRSAKAVFCTDITSERNVQQQLLSEKTQLDAIINGLPTGVGVCEIRNGKAHFLSMNSYFVDLLDIDENKLYADGELKYGFTDNLHPDDKKPMMEFMQRISNNPGVHRHLYRMKLHGSDAYSWLLLEARSVLQPDGSTLVFTCQTDITKQKRNELILEINKKVEEQKYRHEISFLREGTEQGLVAKGHHDLTADEVIEYFPVSGRAFVIDKESSYSDACAAFSEMPYYEQDRKALAELTDREHLIKKFEAGKTHFEFRYCRFSNEAVPGWVSFTINTFRSPLNGHIECFMYSYDITEKVLESQIISKLTQFGYDYLGLIYVKNRVISYYTMNSPIKSAGGDYVRSFSEDYDSAVGKRTENAADPETKDAAFRALCLDTVVKKLDEDNFYIYSYLVRNGNGTDIKQKTLTFTYFDDSRTMIFISRSDTTAQYEEDHKQIKDLMTAKLEADKANSAKSLFLSTMSHDMRTPLNGIIGFTDLALSEKDPQRKQEYMIKVRNSGELLAGLINDTLDLSRIESGKMVLRPTVFSMRKFGSDAVDSVRSAADAKGVILNCTAETFPDIFVCADFLKLQKIFLNLVSNAIKFTPEGGQVDVTFEKTDEEKNIYRFCVSDTGIGISPEFISKIFDPFSQDHTTEAAMSSGTGLGLSIVKTITDLMGGTVSVESTQGSGTKFTLYLPLAPAKAEDAGSNDVQKDLSLLSGKKILICEDNYLNTEIARELIEQKGMKAVCVSDGKQGCELFESSPENDFFAVLMDIRMPVMDGYTAARRIRSSGRKDAKTVFIAAMTADAFDDDISRTFEAGMNAHISKPIDPDRLYDALLSAYAGQQTEV